MSEPVWDSPSIVARFWAKTAVGNPDECWPWLGSNVRGRGTLKVLGKMMFAPRLSLAIHHREWPTTKLHACHSCDNPQCVNPKHLWWGTNSENMKDAVAKGTVGNTRNVVSCKRGHLMTADNMTGRGNECRQCRHASKMRWQQDRRRHAHEGQ